MTSEIEDIFGENTGEAKLIRGYQFYIRRFEWHEFDAAMLIGRFIDGNADEVSKDAISKQKFISILASITGTDEKKLSRMSLKVMLEIVGAVIEVNRDFFTYIPSWSAQIQAALVGPE
jgi:hypothetical protein